MNKVFYPVLMFSLLVFSVYAEGQTSGCAGCGNDTLYSSDAAMLERAGFSAEKYTVVLSWEERARDGSNQYVNGFRIRSRNGGEPFDVYIGEGFRVLGDSDLAALGIPKKNWAVQPISTKSEPTKGVLRWLPPPPKPRVVGMKPTGKVELPQPDMARVLAEDEEEALLKHASRIGVFQEIDPPIMVQNGYTTDSSWVSTQEGFVWSLAIVSTGAKGQRLHFAALDIPPGGQVVVYNPKNPEEAYGPYTEIKDLPELGLWTATCFSDEVVVECLVASEADIEKVDLIIDRTIHVYKGFDELYWGKAAGSCNLDVSCYSDWTNEAKGVAGIGSVGYTGELWCTGSLISDLDPSTQKPFFLTANHCVSSQSQASSIEVYWLYQTPSCNGTPPDPSSVPRTTGGADYLAGVSQYSGNDFTLLRLRNSPPSSVWFLGWTTAAPSTGQNIVPIHHPDGDYKRISFGYIYALDSNFIEVRYNQGTTERGSSGCPLFDQSTKKIIGQLWGGDASCENLSGYDKYGRFDKTYPVVENILSGNDGGTPPDDTIVCGSLVPIDQLPRGSSLREAMSKRVGITWLDTGAFLLAVAIVLGWGRRSRQYKRRVVS
ncbi:MAG TPA: trypsin-like peptidase domain-containing protein [Candidatus Hydrogenedentes bacterium]|nr:trypsin-like peptidase domain-containing protein [Candidatus Hydrogenedentota bacterium]HOL77594.1 trypsin-like peptidase domain-containing protein [Candidatus Hydrogenedentota bacterium]HPO86719.1 trypsin-like peptidase domain-containing protein [Candidatus Hydrogenedentota bacterium]